jgi:hypothetical protein
LFINAAPTISCPREKSWRAADGGTGDPTPVTGIVATAGDTVAAGSMFFSSFFFKELSNQQPPFPFFLNKREEKTTKFFCDDQQFPLPTSISPILTQTDT